jgi:hypothetical protein
MKSKCELKLSFDLILFEIIAELKRKEVLVFM